METTAEEDEELRRRRLAGFGAVLAMVGLIYIVVHFAFSLWLHESCFDKELIPEVLATTAFGSLFALLRRPRSHAFVRRAEIASIFFGTWGFASMAVVLPLVAQPESIVRGALTFVLLAYAAWVPSSARRTALVAGLMTVPLLASVFLAYRKYDPALYDPPAATWPKGPVGEMAYGVTLYSAVWWLIACALAIGFSRTIYGLRKEVRDIRKLGQYTLEEKLGEGGMGVVYRASHAMLRRPTAVKLLLAERAGADALARFEREVRRTAMLTHPNTVTVFDYGRTNEGVFYYAMELLEGANLHDVVEVGGPLPAARVIHLLEQAAASLAEAHGAGLIHRDIKPGNILVVDRGGIPDLVKVVDFGLVKDIGAGSGNDRTADAPLTAQNTITGTPLYLAPETITAPDSIDARADIYALGAVGYWLLTATHVFNAKTVVEVCSHHLHSKPIPPSTRLGESVDPDLEAVILSCLAKDPMARPATANDLRARLRACKSAGAWTTDDAAAWWRQHKVGITDNRRHPSAAPDAFGSTMMVSLARAETEVG